MQHHVADRVKPHSETWVEVGKYSYPIGLVSDGNQRIKLCRLHRADR